MSEYQCYEWQTINRALTAAEQGAVSQLSSHIDVTSTRAWVEYHWSGFKHDPKQVLARYFDAFLYCANWGYQRLAFRFPAGLLDEQALQPYLWESCSEREPRSHRASRSCPRGWPGSPGSASWMRTWRPLRPRPASRSAPQRRPRSLR
jgi:hypothetical protein